MPVTVNMVGGFIAAVALTAVIMFGATTPHREATKSAEMADHVSTQAPAKPAEVLKPAPKMAGPVASCTITHPCPAVKSVQGQYRKVLKNGKIDGRIDCRYVPKIADEFDRKQVLAAAEQYGLTSAQLSQLQVCLR